MNRLFIIFVFLITVGTCNQILANQGGETVLPLQFSSQMTPALSITIQGHKIPLGVPSPNRPNFRQPN